MFPAPASAAEEELVTTQTVDLIWPYLNTNYSYVVVDAGNHFTDPVVTVLERSDLILLVLAPEIASVKSATDALQIFEKLKFDLARSFW